MKKSSTKTSLLENARIGDLCRKLLRMCRDENPEDAKDLVQETWLEWLRYIEKPRQVANPEAYLKTVIKNIRFQFWREKHTRKEALLALEEVLEQTAEASLNDPSFLLAAEETRELLREAIEHLPPRLRQTVELDAQGLSNEQIAEQLGVEITTVKKHLSRARARLEEIMLQEAEHADE